jgi:hypothetical protein
VCQTCGAPLAVQRSTDTSIKSGEKSARGWRVTCTACGETEYYEPGTPMMRIIIPIRQRPIVSCLSMRRSWRPTANRHLHARPPT